jgi:acyl transferase domain-containing protein
MCSNGFFSNCFEMKIMISSTHSAFLFPGQGAYQPGALAAAARISTVVDDTLREVDRVAGAHFGASVRDLLRDPGAQGLTTLLERDPDTLQLAIYAASVATHRLLEARGARPSILIGHSFGEIAALVCGGAFSVRDGAQIVAQRCLALKPAAGSGYMAAVSAPADRCAAMIQMLASPEIGIAVENGPNQTVVSGTAAAMDRMVALAQTLGVSCIRLASAYPFHSAQLEHAAQTFRSALATIGRQPLRLPVYSPILERAYTDQDDLAAALASHLTRPVRFAAAIKRPSNVWSGSSMIFVEMGASGALTKQVRQILGDSAIPVFAPLASTSSEEAIEATVQALQSAVPATASRDGNVLCIPLEQARDERELAQFWQAHGSQILAQLNERFAAFRRDFEAAVPQAKPMAPTTDAATQEAARPAQSPAAPALSREQLQQDIVQLFAQAMEYPPEVFTENF